MLEKIFEKFVVRCKSRSLAQTTINSYANSIKQFDKYLNENGITNITSIVVEDYLATRSLKLTKGSIRNEFVSINTVLEYATSHGFIPENPCKTLQKPKLGKHAIRVFSEKEIHQILGACDREKFVGLRNYTIINTLLGTGVRISELCGMKSDDIDWTNNWIIIHGKGDKDRFVPMSNSLRKILGKYLKARKDYINEHYFGSVKHIFISRTGKPLSKDEIGNIFLDIKKKVGGTGTRFSPHTFRHTFATLWLKNGGDLFTLQKVLGHSSILTTRIYVNLNQSDVQNQMMKYNPLDNENWKMF